MNDNKSNEQMGWVRVTDRMPNKDECIHGSVPVIAVDGYLDLGVFFGGQLRCASDIMGARREYDVVWWLPVKVPVSGG